jgi:putative ABC transport system permease protein
MLLKLDEVRQDLRFAGRQISRKPWLTAVMVLTLALGIGANTAIFSVIEGVLLRPLEYPDPDRLVMIWERAPKAPEIFNVVNPRTAADWQDQARSFEGIALFHLASATLPDDRGAVRVAGATVSANYFSVLGVGPALGRGFAADEEGPQSRPVTVLSHALWTQRFGADPSIVGKTVQLDGRDHVVLGIMPRGFVGAAHYFFDRCDFWVPIDFDIRQLPRDVGHWFRAVARLKPGISVGRAETEMTAISERLAASFPATNDGWGSAVVPLKEAFVGDSRAALLMLFGAVGLVLLIACVNVANLMLSRAVDRRAEFAVRCAVGAGRARLVRQLLVETLALSLAGAALGVLLAEWAIPILLRLSPALPRASSVGTNGSVLAFTFVLSCMTGIVVGVLPALSASGANVQAALHSAGRGGSEGREVRRLRGVLIPAEVALSLLLLIGAGLFVRSFARLMAIDPGFDAKDVIIARVDLPPASDMPNAQRIQRISEMQARVLALPGVAVAGAVSSLPLYGLNNVSFSLEFEGRSERGARDPPSAFYRAVTPGYVEAMGMTLRTGRTLSEEDRADAPGAVVVSRVFADQHFAGEEPLGRRVAFHWAGASFDGRIVGVVEGVRYNSITQRPDAEFYVPYAQHPVQSPMFFAIRPSGNATNLVPSLREAMRSVDSRLVVDEFTTVERVIGASVAQPRFSAFLLAVFSFVAVFLAAVGLYGVVSHSVSKRTREMGIRLALGADHAALLRLVVGEGLRLVLAGVVVGLLAALAFTRLLSSLLYGVSSTDPLAFAVSVAVVGVTASLAAYIAALRASGVDPVQSLRLQ